MTAFGLGLLCGVVGTSTVARIVVLRSRRRSVSVIRLDMDAETLTEVDRQHIAAEFANHVDAVQKQMGEYADALAGEDEELRSRLRAFESGDR